jgi:type IV pilus assembly protein PilA
MSRSPDKSCQCRAGFTLVEIMIVAAFIAMLAALAIPAFQRVSRKSQDVAVSSNARQISAALDMYYLSNGTSTALLSDLVGNEKYLKEFRPVAGETYPDSFVQGASFTITGIGGSRSMTVAP